MPRPSRHPTAGDLHVPAPGDGPCAALLQQLLDQLLMGVILTDDQARPCYINRTARELLARQDGLLDGPTGLMASTASQTRRLRHAVALVAAEGADIGACESRYLGLPRRTTDAAPLLVRLSLLTGPPRTVAVFVTAPEHLRPVPREALTVAFGLTPREAALAGMLADGHGLRECARLLAMGEGTARNHLKHVFEKTVKHSQATLVATLCRMAGPCQ